MTLTARASSDQQRLAPCGNFSSHASQDRVGTVWWVTVLAIAYASIYCLSVVLDHILLDAFTDRELVKVAAVAMASASTSGGGLHPDLSVSYMNSDGTVETYRRECFIHRCVEIVIVLYRSGIERQPPRLPWPDIGHLARWSVSSFKFGFGPECLKDSDPDTFWQ